MRYWSARKRKAFLELEGKSWRLLDAIRNDFDVDNDDRVSPEFRLAFHALVDARTEIILIRRSSQ